MTYQSQMPMTPCETVRMIVGQHFGISSTDMRGPKRDHEISHPRQMAYALCRDITGKSYRIIGRCFGCRDHRTIMLGIEAFDARCEESPEYLDIYQALKRDAELAIRPVFIRHFPDVPFRTVRRASQ